ncbi:MAG: Fic family protein [Bacteroidota bacterium]
MRSRAELGELKGFSNLFRSREALFESHVLMDAVDSLAIDHTPVSRESILESQLYNAPEQSQEHRQVIQYRDALIWAAGRVAGSGLDQTLLNELFLRISPPVRKPSSQPEARRTGELEILLDFIRQDDNQTDPLARCIIGYGMFELIQPYEDKNGVMARLFLTLTLIQAGLVLFPVISIGSYLRKNQSNVQRLLREVPLVKNWCPFVKYLMHGFSNQARETRERLQKMEEAFQAAQQGIREKCSQIHTPELVFTLHALPVISPLRLSGRLAIHYTTATRYLKKLESEGFLENRQAGKYQLYANKSMMRLLVTSD